MDKKTFLTQIQKVFSTILNIEIFEKYKNLIQEENLKTNITSLESDEEIYSNLFYDSLIAYKSVNFLKESVLDIGSGAGIPGILLKIVFPNIKLTIIDSNQKKCSFLKMVVNELNLENVKINCKRAEEIASRERESFDIVTSRAVAPLNRLLEISSSYCKINGILICPKSIKLDEELKKASNVMSILKLKVQTIDDFVSEFTKHTHKVLFLKKIASSDLKYPRTWKEIINKEI